MTNILISLQLIYQNLPKDIANRHVLLLDPILGTGLFFVPMHWMVLLFMPMKSYKNFNHTSMHKKEYDLV
jgi:hypothetical protein